MGLGHSAFAHEPDDALAEIKQADGARLMEAVNDGQMAKQLQDNPGWRLLVRVMDARYNALMDLVIKLDSAAPDFKSRYDKLNAALKELREIADIVPSRIKAGEAAQKSLREAAEA